MGNWSVFIRGDSEQRIRIALRLIHRVWEHYRGFYCLHESLGESYSGRWLLDLGLSLFFHDEDSIESPRDDVIIIHYRPTTYC